MNMRVVLDTNQYVSALIRPDGHPAQILQFWRNKRIEIAVSPKLIEELSDVLPRQRLRRKHNLTDTEIAGFVQLLLQYAVIVEGEVEVKVVEDDPDDNMILACALEAGANYIVSGDRHLLNIGEYQGIAIIRSSEFLSVLETLGV